MMTDYAFIIEAQDSASRDLQLDRAVRLLSEKATDYGILITRHSFKSFTATLSPGVGYGLIQELDLL